MSRRVKAPTFEQAFDPRDNAVAFIRMLLACLVILSHCYVLGGFGPDPLACLTYNKENFGFLGVTMFFVLSGFLITRSALCVTSVKRFLWHRFLRIFPAYFVLLLLSAFFFAPLYYRLEFGSYLGVFSAAGTPPLSYFLENVTMFHANFKSVASVLGIHPTSIATLLLQNPYPRIFNGSLWSLPYECLCYFGVSLFALVGVLSRRRHLLLVCLILLAALYGFDWSDHRRFEECFPSRGFSLLVVLALYFGTGSVAYLYREKIRISWTLIGLAVMMITASVFYGIVPLTGPVILPYILLWLVCKLPIPRFDAFGDFSYGTYIYAFPIQQGLVLLNFHRAGVVSFLFASGALTLVLAALSYHLIEAPALRLKNFSFSQMTQRMTARFFPAPTLASANRAAE